MTSGTSTLTIELSPGESFSLGDIEVQLVHKSGRAARLLVRAPRDVRIAKQPHEMQPQRERESGLSVPSMAP